jgi:YD repeat-containing protein
VLPFILLRWSCEDGLTKQMKRFFLPALILAVFIVAIAGWFVSWRNRSQASDRVIDDLNGPVSQVVIEHAPLVERFGEWVEAARSTESATLYNEAGQISEIRRYRADNKLDYRIQYSYDGDRLLEEASFDPNGFPLYKWSRAYTAEGLLDALSGYNRAGELDFRTVHGYDARGRLTEEVSYNPDGSLSYLAEYDYQSRGYTRKTSYYLPDNLLDYRTSEVFDDADRRLEEVSESAEGDLQYRVSYRYDQAGNPSEETAYKADDKQEYRLTNRYDQAGNVLESVEYNADNEPFFRYRYRYDERGNMLERVSIAADGSETHYRYRYVFDEKGNWIEQHTELAAIRFAEQVFEPTEVTYRMIAYY